MKKINSLHVVGKLTRAGIETWLLNIVRLRDQRLQIDFVVSAKAGEAGEYETEAIKLGCKIYYRPASTKFHRCMRALGLVGLENFLQKILEEGKYDVLHVHGQELIADALKSAYLAKTKVRVAHCHNTQLARGKRGPEMWIRWLRYLLVERNQISRYATDLVACGRDAGKLMAGLRWSNDSRCRVVYCGVSLDAFESSPSVELRTNFLARYHLPADAVIIGHAGSMGPTPQKNHSFILKVFAELAKRSDRYYLFLAGDGPHRTEISEQAKAMGLSSRVLMPGSLPDIPAHMVNLFDAHILPSLLEGLPVVAIEATAAGLYTVMSENITEEIAEYFPDRIERLSLDLPLAAWADRIEYAISAKLTAAEGTRRVSFTPLTINGSLDSLINLYYARLRIGKALDV